MQNDKASRTEKNLKQEIETLKLELGSLKIKFKDLSDKSTEEGGFMELYKRKNDELVQKINKLEE
jgi:cell division protein FtsB